MNGILETQRLLLRPMTWLDRAELCEMLQDSGVMYAYEHAFSEREVDEWIARQLCRYSEDGLGLWAAVSKVTGELVGQIGLTMQEWDGRRVPEIGYLLKRSHWGMGYATEGAIGCKEYAFSAQNQRAVYSIIRDNNTPSQAVARRNGMVPVGTMVKYYYEMWMSHTVWGVEREKK